MKINDAYDEQVFLAWIEQFLPGFKTNIQKVDIPSSFEGAVSIKTLGESELGVRVFAIETDNDPSRRRIGLATDSFTVLKNSASPNAIIAYYSKNTSQWRLSLLTSSAVWGDDKVIIKLSNPKRQSYVLGPKAKVKTPHQFLIAKGNISSLEDLKSRFSLEVVNKEFYKEISKLFTQLVGGTIVNGKTKTIVSPLLKLPFVQDQSQTALEFAVRLIGRVIFCWFLREKKSNSGSSLIPKELVSYDMVANTEDYYHKILEPIFFEVLNKPQKSRISPFDDSLFSQVPYLNGGLFSPQDDDFYKRYKTDLQSQFHNTLKVPDEWIKSFFEVLETYNFTIDENTSFDEELSIDPEMLGRIFENLLAEINPETGESARKSTGSYYTPRVIVDYMVDESLYLYLKDKTLIEEKKLKSLISYDLEDDVPLDENDKEKIINSLGEIKILDPACGSGAFPIGSLQKIVFILQQVDPDAKRMYELEIKQVPPELRRFIQKEYENGSFDYLRKLRVIRDCIYGVDIQPIATEISRLRCFLTLIVDQKIDDTQENRGVQPLPNLDFKFVTANSLISLPKVDKSQTSMFDDYEKIDQLKSIRDDYFSATGLEREQLKTEFVTQQKRLVDQLIKEHGFMGVAKAELTQKLTSWEPFTHKPTSWFDPEWMFGIKKGFDIVIGNPPYIKVQNIDKDLISKYKDNYISAKGKFDLYVLFVEKVFSLINKNGVGTYIQPHRYLQASYGTAIRNKLKNEHGVYKIVNFGVDQVFGNVTTYTGIFFYRRNSGGVEFTISKNIDLRDLKFVNNSYEDLADGSGWFLSENMTATKILNKIYQCKFKITDVFTGVYQGIVTVGDDIFIMEGEIEDDIFKGYSKALKKEVQIEADIMRPSLKGENIRRYQIPSSPYYVFYPHFIGENGKTAVIEPDVFQNNYPLAYSYISNFRDELIKKKKAYKTNPKYWYSLHRARDIKIFEPIKLITPQLQNHPCFTIDKNSKFPDAGGYCLILRNPEHKEYMTYLAVLNSKLLYYFITHTSTPFNNNYYYFKTDYLEPFGLPDIDSEVRDTLALLSEQIFDLPQDNREVIENKIDRIVYSLYDMNDEEINAIEGCQ